MNSLQRTILAIALVVWVGMVIACGGTGQDGSTKRTEQGSTPGKGEIGYIEMKSVDEVWVPVDEKALDELNSFSAAKNEAAVRQMMQQGRVLVCARRTKVTVVDPGILSTTIRIMEGKHEGKTGVIANEFLHK